MRGLFDRLARTLTLALAACRDEPEPASAETPPAAAVDETVIMAVGTEPPIVRVLDAGGEPREPLERGPVARDRQVQIAWDMSPLGRPSDQGMRMRLALTWSASDDREIPSRFSVEHADVTMADVSGGEMRVGELMGSFYALIGGHARRHGPAHVEFVQTAGMTTQPAVPWMLHLFAFAPPSEALGPGARWTMQSKTDEDEQSCTELRTYELVDVQADEITARLQIELNCGPSASAGDDAPTIAYSMKGDLRFARTDVLATSGEITSTMRAKSPVFADEPDGEPIELETTIAIGLSSAPR